MDPKLALRRAAFEAKTLVAQHPSVALPVARRRHGIVVGDSTELVIEGFPRTGTTFAVAAFDRAQPRKVEVACHVHAPAQILAAVRRGIPAMVVIREPQNTVLSFVTRHTYVTMAQALRAYVRFYEPLVHERARFLVAGFPDITSDFGAVIARLNERFGTSFAEFDHTEEHVAEVFAAIDEDYEKRVSGKAFERSVARPSEVRSKLKEELRASYEAPELEGLRARAEHVHAVLESGR